MNRLFVYAGVFVVAAATLMLEILLTRITSVVGWYHLAFLVISLSMLGMTVGAVAVFLWPRLFEAEFVAARMAQSATLFGIATPVAVGMAMSRPLVPVTDLMTFVALVGVASALALPFVFAGIAITLALTRSGLPAGRVYGVDLLGAAFGCSLAILVLDLVDGGSAVLLAGAGGTLAGVCFAVATVDAHLRAVRFRRALAGLGVLAGLAGANASIDPPSFRPAWVKGEPENPARFAWIGWNTYSRVTVDHTAMSPPAMWAPGRNLPPALAAPISQRTVLIDGAAATAMAELGHGPQDHAYLDWDLTSFAHRLRPSGPAAIIGVGGGRDVLAALRAGHRPVVGIEINDLIVRLHRDVMPDFSGIAGLADVELVSDEARSHLTRDDRRYQVITMSLIDTWASTGAGAYSLSENGLYTAQAWAMFLRKLEPSGIFTVSRWYIPGSPGETARMLALAMESLWAIGAADPRRHLVLVQEGTVATLLMSPRPFSPADLDAVVQGIKHLGANILLVPGRTPQNPLLAELASVSTREQLWRFTSGQSLDLTPPTDDRPFFFNMLKVGTWLQDPAATDTLDLPFLGNLEATKTLAYAILGAFVLTVLSVLVPLLLRTRELSRWPTADLMAACSYFGLIGVGFMFVEIGLLSQLNVLLGHPTLALAVLLGGIILFTGVGSLLSGRIDPTRPWVARLYPLVPAVLVMLARLAMDTITNGSAGAPTAVRVTASLALVGVPALGLGLAFPLGLRLAQQRARALDVADLAPWLWGLNGAAGVCASGLALASSMIWGVPATLALGAVCYLALPLCTRRLVRR